MSDVLFMGDVQGCGAGAARPAESRGIRSGAASPRAPQWRCRIPRRVDWPGDQASHFRCEQRSGPLL